MEETGLPRIGGRKRYLKEVSENFSTASRNGCD